MKLPLLPEEEKVELPLNIIFPYFNDCILSASLHSVIFEFSRRHTHIISHRFNKVGRYIVLSNWRILGTFMFDGFVKGGFLTFYETINNDFIELVFRQHLVSYGVILVRLSGLNTELKENIVSSTIINHENEILGNFTVISPSRIRIRKI